MPATIKTIKALKALINNYPSQLYVRWSRGPSLDRKQGQSRDYLSGGTHNGLSAVPVDRDWTTDDKWLARRVTEYRFLKMKDNLIGCHIYSASQVGTDSDGYALIADIKPIANLSGKIVTKLCELKNV